MTPAERQRRRRARIGSDKLNNVRRRKAKARRAAVAKEIKYAVKRARRASRMTAMAGRTQAAMAALDAMQHIYNVIAIDAATRFETYSKLTGMDRSAENHYETMVMAELRALPIPAAADCVLYLWSTVPLLERMMELMATWGFTYSSHVVWVKGTLDKGKIKFGLGYETRNAHELLLIGKRGKVPAAIPGEQWLSVVFAPRTRHSEKPLVFAEMIERMFPDVPKLEMFARRPREGWAVWGNEADSNGGVPGSAMVSEPSGQPSPESARRDGRPARAQA
jgi:N6-adenosine-specific RNA methylase IME4